jgi:hypothetical protein
MADDSGAVKAYTDAIANIKDTAKWMIAALGGIFAVMLGGIQFNAFGFAQPGGAGFWVWFALVIALSAVVLALWLAGAVLVSEGIALDQLMREQRYLAIRNYINSRWAHLYPGQNDVLERLVALIQTQLAEVQDGTRAADDGDYLLSIQRLNEAVYIASWRAALARFKRLKLSFIAIVPTAAAAALIMASHAHSPSAEGKTLDVPEAVRLTLNAADRTTLTTAGIPESCVGPLLWVLVYRNAGAGVDEAATFASDACPSRRVIILDRARVIKAM